MKEIIKDIVIALVIAIIVIQFVRPTVVKESSMEPTLYENNYLFLNRQAYTFGEPERGDIIVFKSNLKDEKDKNKLLIKRVIGLPGERITIRDNVVSINGKPLKEDYLMEANYTPGEVDEEIPEGYIFAMGDNRGVSIDSRFTEVGLISEDSVMGTAFFRLFPFKDIGKL